MGKNKISESTTKHNKGPTLVEINLPEATQFIRSLVYWGTPDG